MGAGTPLLLSCLCFNRTSCLCFNRTSDTTYCRMVLSSSIFSNASGEVFCWPGGLSRIDRGRRKVPHCRHHPTF